MAADGANTGPRLASPGPRIRTIWGSDVFHEARLLEAVGPGPSRLGRDLSLDREAGRFGQRLTLDPDELVGNPENDRAMGEGTMLRGPLPVVASRPAFVDPRGVRRPARLFDGSFGLLGLHGPMPLAWTALAEERLLAPLPPISDGAGDPGTPEGEGAAFFRFLDVIHHRLFLARYRAWADARPALSHDPYGQDPFSRVLAALAGDLGAGAPAGAASRLGVLGPTAHGERSGADLAHMLARWLGAPVHCEELVGEWLELPREEDRWVLGRTRRGFDGLMLGTRSWGRQSRFRLHVGPADDRLFEALLPPRGELYGALVQRVREFVGPALTWDLYVRRLALARPREGGLFVLGRDALRGDSVPPDSWEDRVVNVEAGTTRLPSSGEAFATPSRPPRLVAAKAAVDAALVAVSGEDAHRRWQPTPELRRALRASVLAALWGKGDTATLAAEPRQPLVRWFIDMEHVPDPIPYETFAPALVAARGGEVGRDFAAQLSILTRKTSVASVRLDSLIEQLATPVH